MIARDYERCCALGRPDGGVGAVITIFETGAWVSKLVMRSNEGYRKQWENRSLPLDATCDAPRGVRCDICADGEAAVAQLPDAGHSEAS